MARTKQSTCLNLHIHAVSDDNRDEVLEQAQSVLDAIADGTATAYAHVDGRLDSVSGRTFTARPVGLSIPGVWDKLKNMDLGDVEACEKADFYEGIWKSIPEAIACLKKQEKTRVERMLTSLKASDVDAFDDIAGYISANTGASLTWEEY